MNCSIFCLFSLFLRRQNLVATKRLVRAPLRRQLAAVLDEERRLLVQCWTSNEFQRRARHLVDSGRLLA